MKITLDIKSLIIGFMASALIIMGFSFKNADTGKPGKFRTIMNEKGVMILDTETGAFIMTQSFYPRDMDWVRDDFANAYENARAVKQAKPNK